MLCLMMTAATLAGCGGSAQAALRTTGGGPAKRWACTYNVATEAVTGADGTASAIGWEGNDQGVVTCLGGTFFVQDGIDRNFGFGIYNGTPTTWADADGYLPAQITTFRLGGAEVSITEFADELVIGGNAYVAVYSRVAVDNPTDHVVVGRSRRLPRPRAARCRAEHGGAARVGRPRLRGGRRPLRKRLSVADRRRRWPAAGGFERALRAHAAFWNDQLARSRRSASPTRHSTTPTAAGSSTPRSPASGDHLRHRRQRLRVRVQPRRDRHPGQSLHPRLTSPTPTACCSRPATSSDQGPVRRRRLDLRLAVGHLPDEDGGPRAS